MLHSLPALFLTTSLAIPAALAETPVPRIDIQVFGAANSPLPESGAYPKKAPDGAIWFTNSDEGVLLRTQAGAWQAFTSHNSPLLPDRHLEIVGGSGGAVWIATTHDGLLRFEQGQWEVFPRQNGALPEDPETVLPPAADGTLWAGTCNNGLWRYRNGAGQVVALPDQDFYDTVFCYNVPPLAAKDATLWVLADAGLAAYRDGSWQVFTAANSALPEGEALDLAEGPDGTIWALNSGGLVRVQNGVLELVDTKDLEETGELYEFFAGTNKALWANLWRDGVARLRNGTWEVLAAGQDGRPQSEFFSPVETADGATWFKTVFGVARFDGRVWQHFSPEDSPLPHDKITGMLASSDGALWIGTKGGLARVHAGEWQVFTTANSVLPDDRIGALTEAADGAVWARAGDKVVRLKAVPWEIYTAENSDLPDAWIRKIVESPDGALWALSDHAPARLHDDNTLEFLPLPAVDGIPWWRFGALAKDAAGTLWLGAADREVTEACGSSSECRVTHQGSGLGRLKDGELKFFTKANSPLPSNGVAHIAVTADSAIWAGTSAGLARLHNGTWEIFNAENGTLPDNRINALAAAPDGALWVGTDHGLLRYRNGGWESFTAANSGLPDDGVSFVAVAPDGTLWIEGGTAWSDKRIFLARFHNGEWQEIDLPADVRASAVTADGALWMKAKDKLVRVSGGGWQVFTATYLGESRADSDYSGFHILGATSDGSVWAQRQDASPKVFRFGGGFPPLEVSLAGSETVLHDPKHTFAAQGSDPSYRTASGLLRYRWQLRHDGRVIESTETLEPYLNLTFPESGGYEIQVRAVDRFGSVSAPAVRAIDVEIPG